MNDICRVCLTPTVSKKHSNLFYSSGRSIQLWAKIMACAWVQVFEGDGLPGQICYKCHNKLDIAYHFKQQCEAADAQLRQFIARNIPSKSNAHSSMDVSLEQRESLVDRKPINFNISSERFELPQCDLTLNTLRLLNQELPFLQNIDLRIPDGDFNIAKQEPESIVTSNIVENATPVKDGCDLSMDFKSESFADNEPLFNGLAAKLFENIQYVLPHTSELAGNSDCKLSVWDLQNKQSAPTKLLTNDEALSIPIHDINLKVLDAVNEDNEKIDESNLSFLDDRSDSSVNGCRPDSCSNLSNAGNLNNDEISEDKQLLDPVCLKINKTTCESSESELSKPEHCIPEKPLLPEHIQLKDVEPEKSINGKCLQEQCELCGKIFMYRGYMEQHLRTHTNVKPFGCDQCHEKFSMLHSLVSHRRIHTGEKPYICATCGKRFTQSSSLKAHMRLHTGEKPFKCDICFKEFNQKSNLQTHKISHSGQRKYLCKICNKAFKCQKNLQSHQKLHDASKEFKCSICMKTFQRKSYLRTHLDIHSGKKPHKCKECGHAFSNPSNLTSHMRTHTGTKPYNCNVCKKAFAQSNALARHMLQHQS